MKTIASEKKAAAKAPRSVKQKLSSADFSITIDGELRGQLTAVVTETALPPSALARIAIRNLLAQWDANGSLTFAGFVNPGKMARNRKSGEIREASVSIPSALYTRLVLLSDTMQTSATNLIRSAIRNFIVEWETNGGVFIARDSKSKAAAARK